MAAKVPVIASDIPGFASVLEHDVHGLLVTPKDDLALAQTIRGLIDNFNAHGYLVENGIKHVQQFRVEHVAPRVLELYEACANRERYGDFAM